jgi:hypothetical protein
MRSRWALVAIGLLATVGPVSAASAKTTTIGSASPSNFIPGSGCGECHALQFTTAAGTPSYVVPPAPAGGPWTITSWSARGGTSSGTGAVEVWRPTATANEFRLIAIGPVETFAANTIVSHPVSIPVQAGDRLGILSMTGEFSPTYDSASTADVTYGAVGNPMVGQTTGAPTSNFPVFIQTQNRINAEATLRAPDPPPVTKKCKKKHKKRSAESAKKKKCKKKRKH